MNTVHAQSTDTTPETNTGHVRRSNPPQIRCAECGRRNDCRCLDEMGMLDEAMSLVRELLEGERVVTTVREELAGVLARFDQRGREIDAIWDRGHDEETRGFLELLVEGWGGQEPDIHRGIIAMAARKKLPDDTARELFEAFMRDSRPEPAPVPEPVAAPVTWPAWARAVDAAVERRAA